MRRSTAWLLLCCLHGVVSMLLWWAREGTVDLFIWRADEWLARPWTLWTSAWVHLNTPQLILNQITLGALVAFAWLVRPPLKATLAWFLAWPLAQLSLPLWPQIGYAVGLSGVLHAAAGVLAAQLLRDRVAIPNARRWGGLLLLSLVAKLAVEQPWQFPVVWDNANDMSVVQAIHLTGALWGLGLGLLTSWLPWPARPPAPRATAPSTAATDPAAP